MVIELDEILDVSLEEQLRHLDDMLEHGTWRTCGLLSTQTLDQLYQRIQLLLVMELEERPWQS